MDKYYVCRDYMNDFYKITVEDNYYDAVTAAAVGDLNTVACETGVRTCCCGPEIVTLVNNGETTIVVEQPLLKIKRVA